MLIHDWYYGLLIILQESVPNEQLIVYLEKSLFLINFRHVKIEPNIDQIDYIILDKIQVRHQGWN